MKKFITLIVVAGILAGAYFSNPTEADHKAKVSEIVAEKAKELIPGSNGLLGELTKIGSQFIDDITNSALGLVTEYHNYYLFSKTTYKIGNEEHTLSWGAFGYVFVADSDNLTK